jgi:hypothetical protein
VIKFEKCKVGATAAIVIGLLLSIGLPIRAQVVSTPGLVGTWTLSAAERLVSGPAPASLPLPRGLLVFDAAGHVYELAKSGRNLVTAANQATPAEAQALFGSFGGFWGSYKVDAARKQLTIRRRSGDDSTVASGFSQK